ncbi:hypothetical protein UNPA324_16165 [Bradyrhizobium sp. UNPA324]|nr:hypothetical protein UNPA324_16165 [Bradyrhizobium sp. UNPA324]
MEDEMRENGWHSGMTALLAASFILFRGSSDVRAQNIEFAPVARDMSEFGYILNATKWPWGPLESKIIYVC